MEVEVEVEVVACKGGFVPGRGVEWSGVELSE